AIDTTTHAVVSSIPLPGHPEAFALEAAGPRLFVNIPDSHQVAVLDRAAGTRLAAWDLATGFPDYFTPAVRRPAANFPMALDEAGHRLFIGCRRPACLLVFDTAANRPVAQLALSDDADDIFYD